MPGRVTRARLRSAASRLRANWRTRARHAALAMNPAAFSERTGSPADFATWVARGPNRRASFPDSWIRVETRIERPSRVAVVVHVFYAELLGDILRRLSAVPVPFDLLVTNASGAPISVDRQGLPYAANVLILEVENRGRDLWPLAQLVNAGLLDPYALILKVHTKRSGWRDGHHDLPGSGTSWRDQLLDGLLGSRENIERILAAFACMPRLGMLTSDESVLGPEFWGDNEAVTASLLRRLEIELRPKGLRFAAGSMYWTRAFVLQGLVGLGLSAEDFEDEAGQVNATTAHALERLIGVVTTEAGLSVVGRSTLSPEAVDTSQWRHFDGAAPVRRLRVIPFYLPQFHPIPENDRWWGTGFTEWTNVATARPVYLGHHQPNVPTTTGFYDLRLHDSVALQTSLAERAGIAGFMYYHYWFAGHQLLERPILSRLADDLPLPFCLMWANENWTRRWDGRESDVLIGQQYDRVPAARFLDDVVPILRDDRYLRIDGRAVLAIYRPGQIPELAAVINSWRATAREAGVGELLVLNVDVAKEFHGVDDDGERLGLDGNLGFPPHNGRWDWVAHQRVGARPGFQGNILSYESMADDAIRRMEAGVPSDYFPGVMVGFDNTARRQRDPDIWYGANPYTFRRWLAAAAAAVADREPDRRVVFVNAWNEWAEGAALEPNDRYGHAFLLAVRDVVTA